MHTPVSSSSVRRWRFYAPGPFGQVHGYAAAPAAEPPAAGAVATTRTAVVCLHGTPYSGAEWAVAQGELARDRLVLCLDTPGFGGSDRPARPPSIAEYAAALSAALDGCGLLDAEALIDVLGHHTGAALACEMAVSRPQRVRRLVLSGVPLFEAAQRALMSERFLRPAAIFSDPDFVATEFRASVLCDSATPADRRLALFIERLRAGTEAWWAVRAVFAYDLEATLRRLLQPTLLLMLRDPLATHSRAALALLRSARAAELESSTSEAPLEQDAGRLATAIREFLDS